MRPDGLETMDIARARSLRAPAWMLPAMAVSAIAIAAAASIYALVDQRTLGPLVDRASFVTDTAIRGTIERSVSASGTLVPQDVHVVAATLPGVIETVYVKTGSTVHAGDVVARLSNPDVDAGIVAAQGQIAVARAELESVEQQARASALDQEANYDAARAEEQEDVTDAAAAQVLHGDGFVADQTYRVAIIHARHSQESLQIARSQIAVDRAGEHAKVAQAQAQLDVAAAAYLAKLRERDALTVRAPAGGVVQSVALDPGARVEPGGEIARIADQHDLQAALEVAEADVHDVTAGMPARIDTGFGVLTGRVTRIAPSAKNGSVEVDVSFSHRLPPAARPDLTIDGTIALSRLPDVVSIVRPASAADDSTVQLYRVDGHEARLISVRLGRGSSDRVEVRSGLRPGETVIVSDMSTFGGVPSLRIR